MEFEKKIEELEEITKQLESGDCSLQQCLSLYERASTLAKECDEFLKTAKGKVFEIKKELETFVVEEI